MISGGGVGIGGDGSTYGVISGGVFGTGNVTLYIMYLLSVLTIEFIDYYSLGINIY